MAEVRLNRKGIREVLTSEPVRALLHAKAEEVAATVRAQGHITSDGTPLPVEVVAERDTDRAAVSVAILHPSGIGMEARHGLLRRAAEAAGLDVKEGGDR
jgi:hypothetical protein